MAFKNGHGFLSSLLLVLFLVVAKADEPSKQPIDDVVKRSIFQTNFVFGSASSAYQYEGAAFEDGKGPSTWDTFTHQHPEKIYNGSNADVTVDQYHLYTEDVALMKEIGFNAYRFSISWSRVLPNGKRRGSGDVNEKGIEYYNNLINKLIENDIKPYVTLFHWDTPQALEDEYGGFLGHQIVNDFREFAELCFERFGDRVKHWITINEQYIFTTKSYVYGEYAPGRGLEWDSSHYLGGNSGTEPYIVGHNLILAHAAAVKTYRNNYKAAQNGEIGITLVSDWYEPYSESEADKQARSRALDFSLGWFLNPLVYGDYPLSMRIFVNNKRLPKFTEEEKILITNSYDFLGINYYSASYAQHNPSNVHPQPSYVNDIHATLTTDRDGVSIGPKVSPSSWLAVYPQGLKELLIYIKDHYKNPTIFITENGYLDYDSPDVEHLIKDKGRVKYFRDHLYYLHEAMEAGVKVEGYFAWSLLDNFEWSSGFNMRFGLTYVDFKHPLTRTQKDSAKWFNNFLKT